MSSPSQTDAPKARGNDLKLWYCERCTKLIHPPGNVGHVVASTSTEHEDQHYCQECKAFAAPDPARVPAAVLVTKGDSKIKIAAVERTPSIKAEAEPDHAATASDIRTEPPKPKSQTTLAILVGAGAGVLLLLSAVLLLSGSPKKNSSEPPTQTAKINEGQKPPTPLITKVEPLQNTPTVGSSKPILEPPKPDIEKVAPPVEIKPLPPVVPAKPAEPNLDSLKKALADADAMNQQTLYAHAIKVLDDVKASADKASWWAANEKDWQSAREKTDQARKKLDKEVEEGMAAVNKAAKLEELDALSCIWKPRTTETSSDWYRPSRRIMNALNLARIKTTHEQDAKITASLLEPVEKLEKEFKAKPYGKALETFQKVLDGVEEQLKTAPEAVEKCGDRVAALRVDAQAGKDPELAQIKGTVTQRSPATEISFDFSNAEQVNQWTVDKGAGHLAEVAWDSTKKALTYKMGGNMDIFVDHGRAGLTFLRTPFYFRPDVWVYESDLWQIAESSEPNRDKAGFGILVWDGGDKYLRVRLRSANNGNETEFQLQGCMPPNTNYQSKILYLGAKPTEVAHMQMAFNQGTLNVMAGSAGKVLTINKVPLNFIPKYFALFGLTRDNGSATIGYKNIKMTGILDRELLAKSYQVERAASIATQAYEYAKAALAQRVLAMKNWGAPVNLALYKTATQSSSPEMRLEAVQAVDGNLDSNSNFSHTAESINPWWQVDLGADCDISEINLFNRNASPDHAQRFHVMVSKKPFENMDLETALKNSAWSTYQKDTCGKPTTFPAGCTGRYVRVQMDHKGWVILTEVQVVGFGLAYENLALRKPVAQCSVSNNAPPERAVDGNIDGDFNHGSVIHTADDPEAWWQVDLKEVCQIDSIAIYNRYPFGERLSKYHVFISETPFTSNSVAETLKQPGVWDNFQEPMAGRPTRIPIKTKGRYLRIQQTQLNALNFAEVMVFGAAPGNVEVLENLALRKPASQSSAYTPDMNADKAVDGDTSMAAISHTQPQEQPWWQVDLQRSARIGEIIIYNRNDNEECLKRLNNFQVLVSDQPFPNVKAQELAKSPGVWYYANPGEAGEVLKIPVNQYGRYVRIQMLAGGVINIREVMVMESP